MRALAPRAFCGLYIAREETAVYQCSINMVESLERDLHCSSSDSNASDSEAECVTETDCEEELAQPPNPKQPPSVVADTDQLRA